MKVVLAYKNFAANKNISHIGLGVAALNTSKSLVAAGIESEVWPILSAADLRAKLVAERAAPLVNSKSHVTHVVISAPWIPTADLRSLAATYPDIQFAVSCHSNAGFLQADTNGITLYRQALGLQMETHNFRAAANCGRFVRFVADAYNKVIAHLPNLYYLDSPAVHRPLFNGGILKIGAFGAARPLKNFMSAAAAAVEIARRMKADTQFFMSSGRSEGGGLTITTAIQALLAGIPGISLVQIPWSPWTEHRAQVQSMHLLMQPSYTESFNMVTADGVAEGVPSVVSEAIDWVPSYWQADVDDVFDIARVGRLLIGDPHATADGLKALTAHNTSGLLAWKAFLGLSGCPA